MSVVVCLSSWIAPCTRRVEGDVMIFDGMTGVRAPIGAQDMKFSELIKPSLGPTAKPIHQALLVVGIDGFISDDNGLELLVWNNASLDRGPESVNNSPRFEAGCTVFLAKARFVYCLFSL
ncbi:hypothetical protein Ct61P_04471 [Colletotrichum tofieldiae]|nr:hypothetical protein Ct61P_04471 [Colletotrichum tofieldiae]